MKTGIETIKKELSDLNRGETLGAVEYLDFYEKTIELQKVLIDANDKLVAALIAGTLESVVEYKEKREKAWKELKEHEENFK